MVLVRPISHNTLISQDGVVSPEDCDTIMSQGLGMRYAFMGPFETAHLNAEGKSVLKPLIV